MRQNVEAEAEVADAPDVREVGRRDTVRSIRIISNAATRRGETAEDAFQSWRRHSGKPRSALSSIRLARKALSPTFTARGPRPRPPCVRWRATSAA